TLRLAKARLRWKSRPSWGSSSSLRAASFICSYSSRRRTSSARGSSTSSPVSDLRTGSSMRDLISSSSAAMSRYSPASSRLWRRICSTYDRYWRVTSAMGMSSTLKFCLRMRYSNRSSGPSKASRNTSSASGGMYRSCGRLNSGSPYRRASATESTVSGVLSVGGETRASIAPLPTLPEAMLPASLRRVIHVGRLRHVGLLEALVQFRIDVLVPQPGTAFALTQLGIGLLLLDLIDQLGDVRLVVLGHIGNR